MKAWSFKSGDLLARTLLPAFFTATLICVGGPVSAQTVVVSVQNPPGSPGANGGCSPAQDGPAGQLVVCVDWDTIETPQVSSGTPVSVTWTIDVTKGWMFPANQLGIVIDSNQKKNNGNGAQPWTISQHSSPSYIATNKKENGQKRYGYTIFVVNTTGGAYLLTYDPTIKN